MAISKATENPRSKYGVISRALETADGKAVRIDSDIFKIGREDSKKKTFINNFKLYHKRKFGKATKASIRNGSIFFWR